MGYSLKDIIDKLIDMESYMSDLYMDISKLDGVDFIRFKTLSKVMAKEEKRHIEFLNKIKSSLLKEEDIEIDFFTYDKISQLFYQFKNKISIPEINNMDDLISFILNFEKESLALLIDIKGRVVKNINDDKGQVYKILSLLIKQETKHITDLEPYIRKNND